MPVAVSSPESVTVGEVTVKVGDFFECSWGYDQTNVDFYKVVGFTKSGKSVHLQKWSQASVEGHEGPHDSVVAGGSPVMVSVRKAGVTEDEYWAMDFWDRQAVTEEVPSPVFTKRLSFGGYKGASVSMNSYSNAYLWDGKAQYQTGAYHGH